MRRKSVFACLLLFLLSTCLSPYVNASNSLVESGITQTFKSEIIYVDVLDDGTVLTITETGVISSGTITSGFITPLWSFELNNTVNFAKLDSGEKFIAVIHDSGFLIFDIENQAITQNTTLTNIPDSLDWDNDGDIWVAYHSGIRKAREYRNGAYSGTQT